MAKKTKTNEEKEVISALQKGRLKRSKNANAEMLAARQASENYLKKDKRINIRLSGSDLTLIKRRAVEEAIPYQTLIASILHKFVSGRLIDQTDRGRS